MNYHTIRDIKLNLPITTEEAKVEKIDRLIEYYRGKEHLKQIPIDEKKNMRSFYSKRRSEVFKNFNAGDYKNPITRESILEALTNLTYHENKLLQGSKGN